MSDMNDRETDLERLVREDMAERNRTIGFEAFRLLGITSRMEDYREYWGIDFEYRNELSGNARTVRYGGYPFTEKEELLNDYMKECYRDECRLNGIKDPKCLLYRRWLKEKIRNAANA